MKFLISDAGPGEGTFFAPSGVTDEAFVRPEIVALFGTTSVVRADFTTDKGYTVRYERIKE